MKKLVWLLNIVLLTFLFAACSKENSFYEELVEEESITDAVLEQVPNGIFYDGERILSLNSAFVGGAIANPGIGSSYRCHIYEKKYSRGPKWDEVKEAVYLEGFHYTGVEYTRTGQHINRIEINLNNSIPSLGSKLVILLDQGEYRGGNSSVSSVIFINCKASTKDIGKIDIEIKLTGGHLLVIRYHGQTPYDHYY